MGNTLVRFPKFLVLVAFVLALSAGPIAICELSPTPAEWALRRATNLDRIAATIHRLIANGSLRESGKEHLLFADSATHMGEQYRVSARRFIEEHATWEDATWHGPFTSRLPGGQEVFVRWPNEASDEAQRQKMVDVIQAGTSCIVLRPSDR